jgi:hypothetical protein
VTGRGEVARLQQRLDSTFERIALVTEDELRGDFARYLCVLTCGFLERSIVILLQEHTRIRAAETVQGYVNWRLRNFQNATRQVILDTVGAFSNDWRADLDAFIDDQRGGAIGSLMKQRHRIAHGDWSDISYVRVKEYYASVVEVVDRIADLTNPPELPD